MIDLRNDPVLAAVLDYWERKRDARPMPQRRDIDPTELPPRLLPHLQIAEAVDGGRRWRYRLVGTVIVDVFGKNWTGKHLDEVFSGERQAYLEQVYATICQSRRPVFASSKYGSTEDLDIITRRIGLPLSENGTDVNMIVSALTFQFGRALRSGVDRPDHLDPAASIIEIL